ncbi:little elongation complex subunit 1 [Toxorhynchites rutilus septentrionalis]|uniref:little elongation complex subunit 1 n=1 Tax=Toxorhynchites rutilus septentrionalis TaxID=329112 RepID=UPI002478A422|nr:little elongation complex subunit 1 [Toxorhynchites rutilus septentrionalis]
MSAEEFIYSVIDADNVAQLDVNVIATTLANTDLLIRQIKAQQAENGNLKEKIASLRTSALQIKKLYEAEVDKNRETVNREEDYIRQLKELEIRASAAENAKVNAELLAKEAVAELERKLEEKRVKYDVLAMDAVKNYTLLAENSLLTGDQHAKFRDLKSHVQNMIHSGSDVPEDVAACLARRRVSKKKRKADVELRDQSTMTIFSTNSIGVNTITVKPVLKSSSTCTEDLVAHHEQKSLPKKTVDKATMYSSATVTRSTCTSAFIKRVDVGVNYPEVTPRHVNDILRECVIELPSLLSPILDEIPVQKESVQTQTDFALDAKEQQHHQRVSCGTITNLCNIRRKLDFVRKSVNQSSSQLLANIKKEEIIPPMGSFQHLHAAFHPGEDVGMINPQLTHIWGLLGDTMFRLLGNNRILDSQCYKTINERLAMIHSMADPDIPPSSEMMSEVFAAAAASAAIDSLRQKDGVGECTDQDKRVKCTDDYECEATEMNEREIERPEDELGSDSNAPSTDDVGEVENMLYPMDCPEMEIDPNNSPEIPIDDVSSVSPKKSDDSSPADDSAAQQSIPDLSKEAEEVQTSSTKDAPSSFSFCSEANLSNTRPIITIAQLSEAPSDNVSLAATSNDSDTVNNAQNEVELDDIANELQRMEDGNAPDVPNLSAVSGKHYLDVERVEELVTSTDDDEGDCMSIVQTSPPRGSLNCTSIGSNGTLISPIKVKETNELVKDQFKTPISPAISKRKLRDKLEGSPAAKRGRMSPTTEALLGDDWDRKFSHIKDYFALPLSLNPIEDDSDEEEDGDCEDEVVQHINGRSEEAVPPIRTETNVPVLKVSPEILPAKDIQWNDFKVPLRIDTRESIQSVSDSPESPPLADSPMSPILSSTKTTLSGFSCADSPMSPPLEGRVSMYSEEIEPRIIPLENVIANRLSLEYDNTPIGKTIVRYNNVRRREVVRKITSGICDKEANLVRRAVEVIKTYLENEWTVESVNKSSVELLAVTSDTRLLSLAVMDCAVSCGDVELDSQCSPPAPALPKSIQRLVLLVKTLNDSLFTMDKIIIQELDKKVFTFKSETGNIEATTALTHLYVGIADSNRLLGCTARLYIYKCLYYYNFKGLPLIYNVLKAFPHALPKKGSQYYDNSDAMVSTIRTVLMNINYLERSSSPNAHVYKKAEMLKLLKYFYGYQPGMPTYQELIINLVDKIKANKLKNVDYCMILLAKRKGYVWAKDHIVEKYLFPLLNDYLKQMDPDGSLDDRICCLIFVITAILKTQPNFEDVTGIMQILGSIVEMADGNQKIQEAAVAGLLRFTRFVYTDIYEWLCRWCPRYRVSGKIKLLLATFVHRKENRFWQQLNQREIV